MRAAGGDGGAASPPPSGGGPSDQGPQAVRAPTTQLWGEVVWGCLHPHIMPITCACGLPGVPCVGLCTQANNMTCVVTVRVLRCTRPLRWALLLMLFAMFLKPARDFGDTELVCLRSPSACHQLNVHFSQNQLEIALFAIKSLNAITPPADLTHPACARTRVHLHSCWVPQDYDSGCNRHQCPNGHSAHCTW